MAPVVKFENSNFLQKRERELDTFFHHFICEDVKRKLELIYSIIFIDLSCTLIKKPENNEED